MRVINIAGWSGSGKTTLICKLLHLFAEKDLKAATIKHTHHRFDPLAHCPGATAWRNAGAREIMLASNRRSALVRETGDGPEPRPEDLMTELGDIDIVLIEGFKSHAYDRIEVYRHANGTPLIARDDDRVMAVVTDLEADTIKPMAPPGVLIFGLDDISGVASFIMAHKSRTTQEATKPWHN